MQALCSAVQRDTGPTLTVALHPQQVTVAHKDCARCHTTKPAEEFYHDKHASDGLQVLRPLNDDSIDS
jgi:hypothetical protein